MSQVRHALSRVIDEALDLTDAGYFVTAYDADWHSECEFKQADNISYWKPCPQKYPVDFSGLANAAEARIHPDIQAFYGSFWSGSLEAKSQEGPLSLIQLWNQSDFDRLIENLIGHLMAKQQARQPFTVFFATTDPDSELFLSVDNDTGKVLLEEPGKPPIREVESDLACFLDRLEAVTNSPGIY